MSYDDGAARQQLNASLGLPVDVVLAPIWRRMLAQILDQLIVVVPVVIVAIAAGVREADDIADHALVINIAVVLSAFTYSFAMIAIWGRTVGKFALGTRVVRVDTGESLLWWSAAIRSLVPVAAGVIPGIGQLLSVLVYAGALFDQRRRQGWHDRAAGTIVVMAR